VPGYVLKDFVKADGNWLDDLMRGISNGVPALAIGDGAKFLNAVALRLTPPRSSTTKIAPMPIPAVKPTPAEPIADTRTLLQKLADKFR
jgi:peptidyl-tRNA hydrolase, PTH1 family